MSGAAHAADPTAQIASARRTVDRVATRIFAAQRDLATLRAENATVEPQIRRLARDVARQRDTAAARAAALYRSRGVDADVLESDPGADALTAARRTVLYQHAAERSQSIIAAHVRSADRLRRMRSALRARLADVQRLLRSLARDQAAASAALQRAQVAYHRQVAADRARQAALAAQASSTTRPAATDATSVTATPPTTQSGSGGTTPTTRPTTTTTEPPAPPGHGGTNPHHDDPFLRCVRQRESGGYYGAVNPGGYYGAYQFARSTWDITASHAGRPDLIGVRPDHAGAWDQDQLAWVLYQWQGKSPWGGHCP